MFFLFSSASAQVKYEILNGKKGAILLYRDNKDSSECFIEFLSVNNDTIHSQILHLYEDSLILDSNYIKDYFILLNKYQHSVGKSTYIWRNDSLINLDEQLLVFTPFVKKYNLTKNEILLKELIMHDSLKNNEGVYYKMTSINTYLSNSTNVYQFKLGFWFTEYYITAHLNHKYILTDNLLW